MGKTATKPKDLDSVAIEYEVVDESEALEEVDDIGIPVVEKMKSPQIVEEQTVHLGYTLESEIDGKKEKISIRFRTPAKINPDMYYLAAEWRISTDKLLDVDFEPQWKRMGLVLNGRQIMESGRAKMVTYYIMKAPQEVTEEHERRLIQGGFAVEGPFTDARLKMADIGLPVIKGSDITAIQEAKRILGDQFSHSARTRGEF